MFASLNTRSIILATSFLLGAAGVQAKGSAGGSSFLPGQAGGPVATAGSTDYQFDVTGILSNDELGAAVNQVFLVDVGANSHVIGIGWDTTQFADSPSFLSEMAVMFGSTSTNFVSLRTGVGDDVPGTASYSSGGVVDLVGVSLDFNVDADGKLRLEFFETFDDFADDWDGKWESGHLTIRVESAIPEPSTYALMGLGLAGLAAWTRRRTKARG